MITCCPIGEFYDCESKDSCVAYSMFIKQEGNADKVIEEIYKSTGRILSISEENKLIGCAGP